MTRPVITALPPAPVRGEDAATFAAKANTFVAALPAYGTESNALGVFMENEADAAQASRIAAEAAETGAEAAETAAQAAQAAAEAASNATEWVSGQAYLEGDVVWSPITYVSYRANTNTSGTTDPSLSASWTSLGVPLPVSVANGGTGLTALGTANQILSVNSGATALEYIALPSGSEIIRVARTSDTALTPSNRGNLIDITSGTFTQTFNAAATLTDGWFCYIRNSGTGDITLDPDSSETIDGLTSYIMYPEETRLVQCDGTAFRTVVLTSFYKTFASSGTWTKPPGYSQFGAYLIGGGGSGYRVTILQDCAGGGGGAGVLLTRPSSFFSASESVTIGSGGASVVSPTQNANSGGNSIFAGMTAGGGLKVNNQQSAGGFAMGVNLAFSDSSPQNYLFGRTSPSNAAFNIYSFFGGGSTDASLNPPRSAGGFYGAAAGESIKSTGAISALTASIYAGNGGVADYVIAGAGAIPGGGGGASVGGTSGAGGRGELRIWGII